MADIYFWRQFFVLFSGLFSSLCTGYMLTFPSALNPALLAENTTDIRATKEETSWIAASNGLAGAAGFFILSPVVQILGRKAFHIIFNTFLLIGWIIVPLASNVPTLIAARVIQGISTGGFFILSIIVSEYVHTKRRGYFITIKKICMSIGSLGCHTMVLFWDWRQIASFVIILPILSIGLTFLWPESPYFLAMKGRFDECEKSLYWLKGPSCKPELQELIASQKEQHQLAKIKHRNKIDYRVYLKKDFLEPFFTVCILTLLLDLLGRYYFMAYMTQILVQLIGDKSLAIYCSIASDIVIIVAMLVCCVVIRHMERSSMILIFSSISILLMLSISLIVFLKRYGYGENIVWLCPLIVLFQCFAVNLGVIPVAFAMIGEIFPLDHKGTGSCASGIVFTLFHALTVKITPGLMSNTGIDGTFVIFGASSLVCLVILYLIMPKTKDKTLQQIENELKGKSDRCTDYTDRNNLLQTIKVF